jgi:hypothetical protein
MDYPKRGKTHKIEAESWRVFDHARPANWIVRQTTERDYGIDAYIELINRKDEVSGEIFFVQLKGTEKINWLADGCFNFPGVAKPTINYWLGLPVPVFLVVADLKASKVFFCPVKDCARRQYADLQKQQSLGFPLVRKLDLATDKGQVVFLLRYFQEKWFPTFENYARDLIMRWRVYWEFILSNQGLDVFLPVEPEDQLLLQHLYGALRFLANYFALEWKVVGLAELYERDLSRWKDTFYGLHQESLDQMLAQIEKVYPEIVRRTALSIARDAGDYWRAKNPILTDFADNVLQSEGSLKRG